MICLMRDWLVLYAPVGWQPISKLMQKAAQIDLLVLLHGMAADHVQISAISDWIRRIAPAQKPELTPQRQEHTSGQDVL